VFTVYIVVELDENKIKNKKNQRRKIKCFSYLTTLGGGGVP
jgi:hypothetical protein